MIGLLWGCGGAEPPPVLGELPAFVLTDQGGTAFPRARLADRVWVADFMFTSCPDVCPILSAHMAEIQAHYSAEARVGLLSFTVDPETDRPEILRAYAARFGADDLRWHFLTGDVTEVKRVVTDGFKMVMEPVEQDGARGVLHGERFVVLDGAGRIRAYPDPTEPAKRAVYEAVDALLAE